MKRLLLSLLLLLTATVSAWAQHDALYVYQNDGIINAFLKAEIDSIRYSKLDADSLLCNDYVVQEIWTRDSVYRIPLAAIDSVGLVTPSTIYKPGVTVLEGDIRTYITGADDTTLLLSPSTPSAFVPKKGDKLVSTIGDEHLQSSFLGRVTAINRKTSAIEVVCETIDITDVFERYYAVAAPLEENYDEADPDEDSPSARRAIWDPKEEALYQNFSPGRKTAHIATGNVWLPGFSYWDTGVLPINSKKVNQAEVTVRAQPVIYVKAWTIVSPFYPPNVGVQVKGKYYIDEKFLLAGKVEADCEVPIISTPLKFNKQFLDVGVSFGLFFKGKADIAADLTAKQQYESYVDWEWQNRKGITRDISSFFPVKNTGTSVDGPYALDGSLSFGSSINLSFKPKAESLQELISVDIHYDNGAKLTGSWVPRKSDIERAKQSTDVYHKAHRSPSDIRHYYGLEGEFKFLNHTAFEANRPKLGNIPIAGYDIISEAHYVPSFGSPETTLYSDGMQVEVRASGPSIGCDLGAACFPDGDLEKGKFSYPMKDYHESRAYYVSNFGFTGARSYTIYPTVRLGQLEMLADPYCVVDLKTFIPNIDEFKQTGSHYKKNGYHNNSQSYSFKYEAAITVSMPEADGVSDWGYVYEDPTGYRSFISLMGRKSPVTDSSYAFYRNSAVDNVRLYGYARFKGIDEPFFGPVNDYTVFHIFPVPTTGGHSNVTETSATVKCSYADVKPGDTCGVEYSTNLNSWNKKSGKNQNGEQSFALSGLTKGTRYFYRAYITEDGETFYGNTYDFTTDCINPVAITGECTATTETSATVKCSYSNFKPGSTCGVEYSTDSKNWNKQAASNREGEQSITLNGLKKGTHYFYRAYITDEDGKLFYGAVWDFTTDRIYPAASTGECIETTENSATVKCSYYNIKSGVTCGVECSTDGEHWSKQEAGNRDGEQTITLSGLKDGTRYYYRAYASEDDETFYGETREFTTEPKKPNFAGSWHCTVYEENGKESFHCTIEVDENGWAKGDSDTQIPEKATGSFVLTGDHTAQLGMSWDGGGWANPIYCCADFNGTIDDEENPSHFEGTVFIGWTGWAGGTHGATYRFTMSK